MQNAERFEMVRKDMKVCALLYPQMKLIDMGFRQIGFDLDTEQEIKTDYWGDNFEQSENREEITENEIIEVESEKPLVIFKTEADIYGIDITAMSNFFYGYVKEMSLSLHETSDLQLVADLPIANLGIINDVINQADVVMKGNLTLLPDFDNLPADIKSKLKKGVYSVGESK